VQTVFCFILPCGHTKIAQQIFMNIYKDGCGWIGAKLNDLPFDIEI